MSCWCSTRIPFLFNLINCYGRLEVTRQTEQKKILLLLFCLCCNYTHAFFCFPCYFYLFKKQQQQQQKNKNEYESFCWVNISINGNLVAFIVVAFVGILNVLFLLLAECLNCCRWTWMNERILLAKQIKIKRIQKVLNERNAAATGWLGFKYYLCLYVYGVAFTLLVLFTYVIDSWIETERTINYK